jgi:hypothetical protein
MPKCVCGNALYPTCPVHPPTSFVGDKKCGKFLYIIAKLEAGFPLSVSDRDIILETVRKEWMATKEYSAWRRQRELHQIEAIEKIAEQIEATKTAPLSREQERKLSRNQQQERKLLKKAHLDADEVNRQITGRTEAGLKQFVKRERKKREFFTGRPLKRKRRKR